MYRIKELGLNVNLQDEKKLALQICIGFIQAYQIDLSKGARVKRRCALSMQLLLIFLACPLLLAVVVLGFRSSLRCWFPRLACSFLLVFFSWLRPCRCGAVLGCDRVVHVVSVSVMLFWCVCLDVGWTIVVLCMALLVLVGLFSVWHLPFCCWPYCCGAVCVVSMLVVLFWCCAVGEGAQANFQQVGEICMLRGMKLQTTSKCLLRLCLCSTTAPLPDKEDLLASALSPWTIATRTQSVPQPIAPPMPACGK